MSAIPDLSSISEAHERVSPFIHRTPVFSCKSLNAVAGANLYFKCENFQKIGAFKARGGMNAVLSLSAAERSKGVATHSSGNHAQAVALAARENGIPAFIVMPSNSAEVKKAAVLGYGAELIECEPTLQAREDTLQRVIEETGAILIHPYDDYRIIEGQATAAKELIEDTDVIFDYLLAPVGGGGLLSGTSLAAHYLSPTTSVIGCEPAGADDAYRSFKSGELIPQTNPTTIADGLRTSLGKKPFEIIKKYVGDIVLAEDKEIIAGMQMIWERMKIIIESSSAVPFAALLKNKDRFQGKNVGIIISGGNVDVNKLPF
ncbi:Threonine dehydratase, catabolic [Fulvivirga imtechensis AK7]|uniref:Threonine dehydratase, catabolic n=1 Tax=Fulvivirga imtechensis AK7 TaxID=1237149 RepID=L8JV20_9BACT|nr:pyridoxal-phosphate dependent enzyme [Fulvivirga imtechensis]ELR72851.1 Threonine dehydratase, catabolic [Fulvivirga imtechensis AK7]